MPRKHRVSLDPAQRSRLERLVRWGTSPARELLHARVLLRRADEGEADAEVAESVEVSVRTVGRVRKRFATAGVGAAPGRWPRPPRSARRKLDGEAGGHLVALICTGPPGGAGRADGGQAGARAGGGRVGGRPQPAEGRHRLAVHHRRRPY